MLTTRQETDSFGTIAVRNDRYWGAQTERSLHHFNIGIEKQPLTVIYALSLIKKAAALVNMEKGKLPQISGKRLLLQLMKSLQENSMLIFLFLFGKQAPAHKAI
ncbi:fumarate hydratase, class II [Bartonella sp. 11B]|nr:fumarate hydratase, class II [Bartonella sp. 11B]